MTSRCVAPTSWRLLAASLIPILAGPVAVQAQSGSWNAEEILATKAFARPPEAIAEAALAPRHLNVTLTDVSPDRRWFLDEVGDGLVTMDVFSKPFHELGGMFIDYQANRNRTLTIRNNAGLQVFDARTGAQRNIQVPDGARVSGAAWSPDGSSLAFFAHFEDGTHIYLADPENGRSRQVTRRPVLATLVTSFEWTADGRQIATVLVPEDRAPMPVEPVIPTGPQVKLTEDGENRLRTYASLMATPHDEALLEWHATGQLALIDVDSRDVHEMGEPTMVRSMDFSPTGEYARVTRMVKPFSYVAPVNSFGRVEEIWDTDGNVLAELEETPLNTGIEDDDDDDDSVERRQLAWREDGQGLSYLEQEPAPEEDSTSAGDDAPADAPAAGRGGRGGAGGQEDQEGGARSRRMDRVMQWLPPFDSASARVVYEQTTRMQSARFSPDHQALFITERQGGNTTEVAVFLDDPETKHRLVRYGNDDFYDRPGSLVMTGGRVSAGGRGGAFFGGGDGGGTVQLAADGEHVFYAGTQYDEDPMAVAPRAFLDRLAIRTGDKERVWEADNEGVDERILAILDIDALDLVVNRESPSEIGQSWRRQGETLTRLTRNVDYSPDLTSAPVERFVVERPDGFRFRVTVNLPPGYQEGTRLPAMFWFYPREYEDQESYDEGARTYNKNSFPGFGARSMEYLIRLGYAVVEPDAPIVGPAGQMNNRYEHDLRNNLSAVIDELDRREMIDRSRLGIGGHSYGAFSTLNAMVHTPFFKAGIAGDGNYNRTLTPLAFQNERRYLWDAKDVYLSMSPFLYANELTGAVLLYHGLQDQNVGTHPSHSPRLFHALNGLGKTAAMYLYPFEDHGPATEETTLDLWARWTAWLEVYVKNPQRTEASITFQDGDGGW
jgi:dipeptidyl aminopeptidase/acylaminoacyl peptidase